MLLALVLPLLLAQVSRPLTVRVTQGQTGEPVSRADVRWIPFGPQGLEGYPPDPVPYSILVRDDLFRSGQPLAQTLADGRAVFPWAAVAGVVCVSQGERRGCAIVSDRQTGEVAVQLFRDWPLDVEVVDPSGAPLAGLGVCLRYSLSGELGYRDALVTRVAIVDGRAHIAHAGFYQETCENGGACFAGLTGWVGKPMNSWLPREEPPTGSIRLTLPPHGSVRIRVVDEKGEATDAVDPLWIGLAGMLPDDVAWPVAESKGIVLGGPGFAVQRLERGVATIAHVAVGAKLQMRARRNGDSSPSPGECAGPARAGETTEGQLRLGSGCATLRGRVRLPKGMRLENFALSTDGNFVLDLDPGRLEKVKHELSLLALSRDRQSSAACFVCFDQELSLGVHDLGELVLEYQPVVAAGRVLDARTHAGIPGVRIQILPGPPSDWPHLRKAVSDAEGRFELHEVGDLRQMTLEFVLDGPAGKRRTVQEHVRRGARNLTVELGPP